MFSAVNTWEKEMLCVKLSQDICHHFFTEVLNGLSFCKPDSMSQVGGCYSAIPSAPVGIYYPSPVLAPYRIPKDQCQTNYPAWEKPFYFRLTFATCGRLEISRKFFPASVRAAN